MLVAFAPESTVFIAEAEYRVPEDIGEVLIPVQRTGDILGELMVICSTVQGRCLSTRFCLATPVSLSRLGPLASFLSVCLRLCDGP